MEVCTAVDQKQSQIDPQSNVTLEKHHLSSSNWIILSWIHTWIFGSIPTQSDAQKQVSTSCLVQEIFPGPWWGSIQNCRRELNLLYGKRIWLLFFDLGCQATEPEVLTDLPWPQCHSPRCWAPDGQIATSEQDHVPPWPLQERMAKRTVKNWARGWRIQDCKIEIKSHEKVSRAQSRHSLILSYERYTYEAPRDSMGGITVGILGHLVIFRIITMHFN